MLPDELQTAEILIASPQWRNAIVRTHYSSIIESYRKHLGEAQGFNLAIGQLMRDGVHEFNLIDNTMYWLRKRWSQLKSRFDFRETGNHINLIRVDDYLLATHFINAIERLGIITNASLYFGSDNIILSDIYLMHASRFNNVCTCSMDIAGYWHRDSMGRSLKVFVPLEVELGGIQTQIIRHSNVISPLPQLWEMLRASSTTSQDDMIRLTDLISSHCSTRIFTSCSNIDTCLVFDTNSFHRGRYMAVEGKIGAERIHIQCTISYRPTLYLFSQLEGHGIKELSNKLPIASKDISAIAAQKLSSKQFVLV